MKARIFSNSSLQGHYHKLIFLPSERIHTLPGQFVMLRVCAADSVTDPLLSRPFSIHRQAMDGSIEILYKVVGKGTDLLTHLRKGDYIEFLGPLGNGFPIHPPINPPLGKGGQGTSQNSLPFKGRGRVGMGAISDEALIIAGGIGVAPMLYLIEVLKSSDPEKKITVFLGGRGKDDLLCVEELKSLTSQIFLTTNDGSVGTKGCVTDALHEYLHRVNGYGQGTRTTVYACGPTPMLRKVIELTEPPDSPIKTYLSLESAMACGIGLCMGCVVKKKDNGFLLVCKDGPVFNSRDINLI